jgi:hypothetical protein
MQQFNRKPEGRDNLEDVSIHGKKILKGILKN